MEWSHTHFDGYELLAVPSESPASIVVLDSSALVLVQRVLLPEGDAPPRALTWQPGGASTGCSSGALACIVSARGRSGVALRGHALLSQMCGCSTANAEGQHQSGFRIVV